MKFAGAPKGAVGVTFTSKLLSMPSAQPKRPHLSPEQRAANSNSFRSLNEPDPQIGDVS